MSVFLPEPDFWPESAGTSASRALYDNLPKAHLPSGAKAMTD